MKIFKYSILILIVLFSACAGRFSDSSHVISGEKFPSTKSEEILVYFEAPTREFTVIGLVESSGLALMGSKQKERAMKALKEEAAKIGANGVIITSSSTKIARGFEGEPAGEENVLSAKAIRFK